MSIKKLLAIFLFSINIIPKTETTLKNRFANIRITSFNKKLRAHVIRYTFISSVKCSVILEASVIKSDGSTSIINSKTVTIDGKHIDRVLLSSSYVKDGATLLLSAKSDTYRCLREFLLFATIDSQTITSSTSYVRNNALQICDADGYVKRYNESIKFSINNNLIRSFPYISVNNLKLIYQSTYAAENIINDKEVLLIIDDADDNFPLLQDENKNVEISYILKETNTNTYQLELNEKLYYNSATLLLSRVPKDGFIPTTNIFIPKNSKTTILKTIYKFNALGYQGINANVETTNILKKYVGSCSSSKYCVKIDESNNYQNDNEIEVKLK